jgi:hypothetical protein
VSGLYLDGGPARLRSARRCSALSGTPDAGTITVTDPATGRIVAAVAVRGAGLAKIPLAPGTYDVVGTFATAYRNGQHMQSQPVQVTIAAGETVRQDVSVGIP